MPRSDPHPPVTPSHKVSRRPLVRFARVRGLLCLIASTLVILMRASGMRVHTPSVVALLILGTVTIAWTATLSRRAS